MWWPSEHRRGRDTASRAERVTDSAVCRIPARPATCRKTARAQVWPRLGCQDFPQDLRAWLLWNRWYKPVALGAGRRVSALGTPRPPAQRPCPSCLVPSRRHAAKVSRSEYSESKLEGRAHLFSPHLVPPVNLKRPKLLSPPAVLEAPKFLPAMSVRFRRHPCNVHVCPGILPQNLAARPSAGVAARPFGPDAQCRPSPLLG